MLFITKGGYIITKRNYLLVILVAAFILQISLLLNQYNETNQMEATQAQYEELSKINHEEILVDPPPYLPETATEIPPEEVILPTEEFIIETNPDAQFLKINSDYVGWLTIENTKVDYPVVSGPDNEYYLDKNFYKEQDIIGSIYMDHRNLGNGLDTHTILYGHYTERGLMFGDLDKYLDADYLKDHKTFTFRSLQGEVTYEIFSVHISPSEGPFLDTTFFETSYGDFQTLLKETSQISIDAIPTESQKIISLITCNYAVKDGRLFIHAMEVPSPSPD